MVHPIVKELYISCRPTRVVTRSCVGLYNEEQALTTATVCAVEIEHGDFTPLVLSEIGVRGPRLLWPSKTIKLCHRNMANLTVVSCTTLSAGSSSVSFTLLRLASEIPSFHAPTREINLNNRPLDLIHSKVHPLGIWYRQYIPMAVHN